MKGSEVKMKCMILHEVDDRVFCDIGESFLFVTKGPVRAESRHYLTISCVLSRSKIRRLKKCESWLWNSLSNLEESHNLIPSS